MSPGSVSVVVAVHNGAARIAEALAGVQAQTVPVHEVIVVDDGSTDDTPQVVRRAMPGARLIRQPQRGPAAARNAAAAAARGDWLAVLDHDDLWPSGRNAALLNGAGVASLVCGRVEIEAGATPDPRLLRANYTHIPFLLIAALIRRSAWQALGGMDEMFRRGEDTDFYLRLIEAKLPVAYVDAVTLIYRPGPDGLSRQVESSQEAMLEVFRRTTARRRQRADAPS